jgi:large subunit ribosomal protein L13
MNESSKKIITVDAANKSFGRVASEVAKILMGKNNPLFERHNLQASPQEVRVINLRNVRFSGKKFSKKVYYRHTGYIGHLKEEKLETLWKKNPKEVFKKTVSGMLPKNKLRKKLLKRLKIEF